MSGLEGNISFVVDSGYCRNSSSVEVLRIRGCCCIVVHCSATNPKKKSGIYTVFSKSQKTPYRSRLDPKGWIKGGVSVATFFQNKMFSPEVSWTVPKIQEAQDAQDEELTQRTRLKRLSPHNRKELGGSSWKLPESQGNVNDSAFVNHHP